MNTILFVWNPNNWHWDNLSEAVVEANQTGKYFDEWSCGNVKSIKKGDRAFLVKLGTHPKGIIGSGFVASDVFQALHWDKEKAEIGKMTNKVHIEFDVLSEVPLIIEEELKHDSFLHQTWFPQMSGISIKSEVATHLELLWAEKTGTNQNDNNAAIATSYSEGRRVLREAYTYERNTKARTDCLEHYGYKCVICGFDFLDFYGDIGKDFIHVHHRKPVSEIGKEYFIDPITDLVPICPNCHAMIHRKVPALSVEQLRRSIHGNS